MYCLLLLQRGELVEFLRANDVGLLGEYRRVVIRVLLQMLLVL